MHFTLHGHPGQPFCTSAEEISSLFGYEILTLCWHYYFILIRNSESSTSEIERTIEVAWRFGQPDSSWREGHVAAAISL
jgi:hypothetical protein